MSTSIQTKMSTGSHNKGFASTVYITNKTIVISTKYHHKHNPFEYICEVGCIPEKTLENIKDKIMEDAQGVTDLLTQEVTLGFFQAIKQKYDLKATEAMDWGWDQKEEAISAFRRLNLIVQESTNKKPN